MGELADSEESPLRLNQGEVFAGAAGEFMIKSVIGAWFLTHETSNTSLSSVNHATMMLMGMNYHPVRDILRYFPDSGVFIRMA
ncbi:MAG: hypothetical protein K2K97_05830 [Muribaculaceae bacterium]|nr:hypothetical protein [Muribaculaceae bacterium]